MDIKILVTETKTGEVTDITNNLYWFEEYGVRQVDGKGNFENYLIEIFVNGVLAYSNANSN